MPVGAALRLTRPGDRVATTQQARLPGDDHHVTAGGPVADDLVRVGEKLEVRVRGADVTPATTAVPTAGGPDGGLPPFEQERRHLAAEIRSGTIAPGAVLPSTRRLAAEGLVSHVRGTPRWVVPAVLTSPPPG
ncbi:MULTISPECIES: hypothetical protein [unclassified Blastococcus]